VDDIIDDFLVAVRRCDSASTAFDRHKGMIDKLMDACNTVGSSWSGSWIGYQATVYTANFQPKRPGEFFDSEWGMQPARAGQRYPRGRPLSGPLWLEPRDCPP
jgi:hypothetical protein